MSTTNAAMSDPQDTVEGWHDDTEQPCHDSARWDLSWGCAVTIGHEHTCEFSDGAPTWSATVSMSGEDKRIGLTNRAVTPEQIVVYAHKLLALVERHTPARTP